MGKRKIYTEEELAAIASDYTIIGEFRKQRNNIYSAIRKRGLLDKLCGHMEKKIRHYSDEELAAIAETYHSLTEFREKEKQAYRAMQRRGLIERFCGHMKRTRRCLTNGEIAKIALKYKTKKDFRENAPSAYGAACERGILENVCRRMERLRAPNHFYTKEFCHTVALDYKTRTEFQAGNKGVYKAALKHGWLDDICGHMTPSGEGRKRKVYVYTFDDGYAYVGLTDDVSRRKKEHFGQFRDKKKKSPVLNHIKETGARYEYNELTDWLDLDVVGQVEDDYIKKYTEDGWKMLNRRKGGGLGGRGGIFSSARIRKIVAEYEYAEDFKEKEPGIYEYLCAKHLYSEYCSDLKHKRKEPGYWSLEKSLEVIPECETRTVFQKRYYQAYVAVKEEGLLDKYFPPLVRPRKWTLERSVKVARLCKSRIELHKKYPMAYFLLQEAGLLGKLIPSQKYFEKYDDEEKMKIIASCKTKRQLHDQFRSVYDWLRLSGRIDEFFPKRLS